MMKSEVKTIVELMGGLPGVTRYFECVLSCEECRGTGILASILPGTSFEECPICGGSGLVKASIKIEYERL